MKHTEIQNWKKYCGKNLVEKIKEMNLHKVVVESVDNKYVYAKLITQDKQGGVGWSICSAIENFDLMKGVPKAVGRAVRALETKETMFPVRRQIKDFPNTWTMKMVRRLKNSFLVYKSIYRKEVTEGEL